MVTGTRFFFECLSHVVKKMPIYDSLSVSRVSHYFSNENQRLEVVTISQINFSYYNFNKSVLWLKLVTVFRLYIQTAATE